VDFLTALKQEGIDPGSLEPGRFLTNHHVIMERLEALCELED
jgi:hypothetical protein